jgi:asparagine synthase (glutamine-hydrolysing)
MCGLVGYLGGAEHVGMADHLAALKRMSDRIVARGPDSEGQWADEAARIGLGHRRLAVVDLSPAGQQPMHSPSGRYVIAYNGEIYNHLGLRKQLAGTGQAPSWRGHSDTETLLAGFDAWGIEATLRSTTGMFAIAVWDRSQRTLTLARDRMGEKPLYYGWQGQGSKAAFLFGSELKGIKAHTSFTARIDRGALSLLMRHNYVPAPHTIYEDIHKLEPGCLLTVSLSAPEPRVTRYWSALDVAAQGASEIRHDSDETLIAELEALLSHAIGQQMMADVPLGAFLSGGIDSSTVVALMQAQSARPIRTFTIGFNESGYNEAAHAKAVAQHLGTDHTELYVTPQQALEVIPSLPTYYSEPFSDSSQIPTFLVSKMAQQHVTVCLSGDGGDELFCGYNRYVLSSKLWQRLSRLPQGLRRALGNGITAVTPDKWNQVFKLLQMFVPKGMKQANWGDKLHKGADVISSPSLEALYLGLISHWQQPSAIVLGGHEHDTLFSGHPPTLPGLNGIQRMMALDTVTYLPDDILVKLDRAAMAVSLEGRVPLLDHRVAEFAWRLPHNCKLRDGQSKWLLRQVLYRHVPRHLIERPKMGFGVPIDAWLRGPLKEWGATLLDESRLRNEGYFEPGPVLQKWKEHQSGQRNWQYHLWDVLMFQAWLEHERG